MAEEICDSAPGSARVRHAFPVLLGLPGEPCAPLCGASLPEGWRLPSTAPACTDCREIFQKSLVRA